MSIWKKPFINDTKKELKSFCAYAEIEATGCKTREDYLKVVLAWSDSPDRPCNQITKTEGKE